MVFLVKTVPDNFVVPVRADGPGFVIRPLTVDDVVKDFSAAVESTAYLVEDKAWGEHQTWPIGLTMRRDLADVGWHETEFRKRTSFAYGVMTEDDSRMLGCVYVMPTQKQADAEVYYWVTAQAHAQGLLDVLAKFVESWIEAAWPFTHVLYPGRRLSWDDYAALADNRAIASQVARVGGSDAVIGSSA